MGRSKGLYLLTYDANYLERVYIAGDGAPWLKVGCEVLEKAHYVLDRFHMESISTGRWSIYLTVRRRLRMKYTERSTGRTAVS